MINKKRLSVRLSNRRSGNTFLTLVIRKNCDINNCGEIFNIAIKKYSESKTPWKLVTIEDIFQIIDSGNLSEINLMDHFEFIEGLENKYDVLKYGLIRENCLKSVMSALIKFDHIKLKKEIFNITEKEILSKVKKYEAATKIIKTRIDQKFLYKFEDLYFSGEFQIDYFKKMMNDLGIPIKSQNLVLPEKEGAIKNYADYVNPEVLMCVSKSTGYEL